MKSSLMLMLLLVSLTIIPEEVVARLMPTNCGCWWCWTCSHPHDHIGHAKRAVDDVKTDRKIGSLTSVEREQ